MNFNTSSEELKTRFSDTELTVDSAAFSSEQTQLVEVELFRIEIYEDAPTIHRETFVRENVQIKEFLTQATTEF